MRAYSELGVGEATVAKLIEPLLREADQEDLIQAFSSVAWSALSEPGDSIAGLATMALGSTNALIALRTSIARHDQGRHLADEIMASHDNFENVDDERFRKRIFEAVERWRPRFGLNDLVAELETVRRIGSFLITRQSPGWPIGLNDLEAHSPHVLYVSGNLASLSSLNLCAAFVGARAATEYGAEVTKDFVSAISNQGISTVSGGAYGIDAVTHRASIALRVPTVAIMAGGLARLYPPGNHELLSEIKQTGLLISELPPSREPTKWRFLQRNRLIAAISQATLVVEAGWRSGSISTANHAASLGRPVGAIPGPIGSQASMGCHQLIRDQKAQLMASPEDFVALIKPAMIEAKQASLSLGDFETRVLDALSQRPKTIERISVITGMSIRDVSSALGSLERAQLCHLDLRGWRK